MSPWLWWTIGYIVMLAAFYISYIAAWGALDLLLTRRQIRNESATFSFLVTTFIIVVLYFS
jgi:hypothetical protein